MIDGLTPYPKMKDSGIEWLGEVPAHWSIVRAKSLLGTIDVRSEAGAEELLTVSSKRGVIPRKSASVTMFKAESYAGHKLCWQGDLVINSLWAWARGLGVSQHYGIVSTAYSVYRPDDAAVLDPRYLHELVRSEPFHWELHVRSKGVWTSRLQLTDDSFLTAPMPLPPIHEQWGIVRFLKQAERRIQRYVRAKQKLIKLLEEQKQAIIHRAVTCGLNLNVRRKPSGVEWLGEVPEHWEVRRISSCLHDTRSGIWGSDPTADNEQDHVVCLRVADFDMDRLGISPTKLTQRAIPGKARLPRILQSGDLLMEKSGGGDTEPVGRVVRYEPSIAPCAVTSNFIVRLRPNPLVAEPEFLLFVLASMQVTRRNIPCIKQTTGIQNLNERRYLALDIGLPPLDEQHAIIHELKMWSDKCSDTVVRIQKEIALLREAHTRLVADVVTGKLDVREVAARLLGVLDEDAASESDDAAEDDSIAEGLDELLEEVEA